MSERTTATPEVEQSPRRLEPYPDPGRPGVIRVPLASGKYDGLEALIDADVLPVVRGKRWNWSGARANGTGGSVVIAGEGSLARIIMGIASDPTLLVSHRNGDRFDCRRENLIVRTRSESRLAAKRPAKWDPPQAYPDPDRRDVIRVPVCSSTGRGMDALIDAADLPRVQGKRWSWSPGKPNADRGGSVVLRSRHGRRPSLGRIILGIDDPEQIVCHRNGDRLDHRRTNLVVRTRSQLSRHRKKVLLKAGAASSSRFKGVTRTESGRKWAASIVVSGKTRNLGRFRSEIDAALAYDAALRELTGPDAPVNLPDAAEVERLRALEPVAEETETWPPPGMVDRHEACAMFGVSLSAWRAWQNSGRITCGQFYRLPNDKPGRCKLYPRTELERLREEIEKLGKPYPHPGRPGVWRVPLKGYLTYREALIDEVDLPIVEGKNWNWSERHEGSVAGNVILATTGRTVHLHRLIAGVTDPKVRVSFANGDPLDCRRENLLVRTLAETAHASRKMGCVSGRKYSSGFKGVSLHADRALWAAQIRKDGVGMNLGRFATEREAALAYDAAARVLFGEHARLNFPDVPSSGQAMAAARLAMDGRSNQERTRRRRQRDIERELRRAAANAEAPEIDSGALGDAAAVISRRVARRLFDVSRPVWRRWRRFGWLPARVTVGERKVYRVADIERLLQRCGLRVLPYPDPQRPGVYRVPLTGETANGREALIDADAVPLVRTRRWRFNPSDAGRGGEVASADFAENVRLHYVVMGAASDAAHHIGHRNDDPLDCRRANLVVRTLGDTHANHRKQSTYCGRPCTSRFKGVCWLRRPGHWLAYITKDRVQRRLGSFRDEIAAAQAYDEAARELFGEHARLNFPDGVDAWLEREPAATEAAPTPAAATGARAAA